MKQKNESSGLFYALIAFLLWGGLPIYWKAIDIVPASEILAHRILWAMIFLALLVHFKNGWQGVKNLFTKKNLFPLLLSTFLVGINWFLYIWGVNNHHILESSLGYYINPLMNIFFGIFFFKETLTKAQWFALFLAFFGVAYLTYQTGRLPLLTLAIAISFCLYGVIHKKMNQDALDTLFVETLLLSLPALVYLLSTSSHFVGFGTKTTLLLAGSGVVTATPLLLFIHAASKIRLSTLGFVQYLSPTGQFLCGLLLFGEHFSTSLGVTFAFIWLAVTIYMFSDLKRSQLRRIKSSEL